MWKMNFVIVLCFFASRRRNTSSLCDWSSDVCSSDLDCIRKGGDFRTRPFQFPFSVPAPPQSPGHHPSAKSPPFLMQSINSLRLPPPIHAPTFPPRSEERRVGKEGRSRWSPYH